MKKILFIANSFGVDATRYLYGIARAAHRDAKVVTLCIGGCSLYRHYRNMLSEEKAYEYYINGILSGLKVSLKEALLSDEWDIVVTQQCSPDSGKPETYFPYLPELAAYVRKMAPAAALYLQETWSFAEGHKRFALTGFETRGEMIPHIRGAYARAVKAVEVAGVIPSLDAMCKLYDILGDGAYRDGFHCHLGIARYMLACLVFLTFWKDGIDGNSFRDFDVPVSEEEVLLAQTIAKEVAAEKGLLDG